MRRSTPVLVLSVWWCIGPGSMAMMLSRRTVSVAGERKNQRCPPRGELVEGKDDTFSVFWVLSHIDLLNLSSLNDKKRYTLLASVKICLSRPGIWRLEITGQYEIIQLLRSRIGLVWVNLNIPITQRFSTLFSLLSAWWDLWRFFFPPNLWTPYL